MQKCIFLTFLIAGMCLAWLGCGDEEDIQEEDMANFDGNQLHQTPSNLGKLM